MGVESSSMNTAADPCCPDIDFPGRDKLPDLGWVAVKIELHPHSTKPGVTVPFITSIAVGTAPEI